MNLGDFMALGMDEQRRILDAASRQSRPKALLDNWDKRIDRLREQATACRKRGDILETQFLEGKASGLADAYGMLQSSNV